MTEHVKTKYNFWLSVNSEQQRQSPKIKAKRAHFWVSAAELCVSKPASLTNMMLNYAKLNNKSWRKDLRHCWI